MCNFFSCISDGKGQVLYFTAEEIVTQMAKGNPENYSFNSHSSIADFHNIKGTQEDKWNKWEYDTNKKELKQDTLNTIDDSVAVIKRIEEYLKDKDISFLINLYNRNSGDRNSGDMNSGDRNSGNMNSGNRNSGNRNSGNMNNGYMNSGNRNSGDRNSGNRNSGYMNSGDRNSGDRNSGDHNSGSIVNHFCTKENFIMFDKKCTKKDSQKMYDLYLYQYFNVNTWIDESQMTDEEKENNPTYSTTGGYIRKGTLKECWKTVPVNVLKKIKKLKNFDAKKFKKISGLNI
jgi:hypothetical protein